jgi:hypothetical protein
MVADSASAAFKKKFASVDPTKGVTSKNSDLHATNEMAKNPMRNIVLMFMFPWIRS